MPIEPDNVVLNKAAIIELCRELGVRIIVE